METSASKFTFRSKSYLRDKIRSNCGKRVLFQHDNYETKTSKLAVETFQTAELSLKIMKNSCVYDSKRITRTGDNVGKTELLPPRAPERILIRASF